MSAAPRTPLVGPRSRPAVGRVVVALVIDMVGFGVVIPVFPRLIRDFVGGDAAMAARYIGWIGATWALASFLALPVLSGLSDRFGRRPVILISMFGLTLDCLAMAMAPSLIWLFIGRLISGAAAATFATSSAYIADITAPDERAAKYGLVSVAVGIGYMLGPALGGFLGDINVRAPFWAAAALSLTNWLYVAFALPESLPRERRAPFSFRRANPVAAMLLYARRPDMLALAGVVLLYYLAQQAMQSTLVPYVSYRYGWNSKMVGIALTLLGLGSIAVQGVVIRPFVRRFGERRALCTGLVAGAIGLGIYGAAPTTGVFLGAMAVAVFSGLVVPGFQGLLTRMVSPSEQGRLQGANMGLLAVASLFGPILFTEVFARSVSDWRGWSPVGAPFYLACALMTSALALAVASGFRRGAPDGP
jgi:DHA1 family tetracycline resistance protein-like MFS transporter